jgi:ketosteroid isomerase-like protein
MKTLPIARLTATVLITILLRGWAFAQVENMDAQMEVVIKLRIHRALQSTEETAAGVFIGKDRQNAYFITACHAVIQDDARVHSIQLQFHDSPQVFTAFVFEHYDPVLDLAVVTVPVADLPSDMHEIVRKDAELGVPIHVIGHPSAGDWSVASGTVQNLNTASGDIHRFTTSRDNALAEGHSGGPVFDASGDLLGMHTASGPTYGLEAKSAEIINQLAAWHVPTNNVTSVRPDHSTTGDNQQRSQEAVNQVIDAYINAYNRKDAESLWRIWPNPPVQTRHAIQTYFSNARSITMHITDRRVESSGDRATVMGQSYQNFVPKSGNPQRAPDAPITIELERQNGNWLIVLVR